MSADARPPVAQAAVPGPDRPTPPTRPVKQTERPHPLTPFIRGWLVLVVIVVNFWRQLLPNEQNESILDLGLRWILLGVLAIVLLAGAIGYVSWRFTRFVIDDDELRVETGVLFKSSKKIAFERLQSVDVVQPLAARMFGLAELRLESGAGSGGVRLRYLARPKASRLRDYLLARAHGSRTAVADTADAPVASLLTDARTDDRALVTMTPQRLVAGLLLSSEFVISVLALVVVLVVTTWFEVTVVSLGVVIPMLVGTVSLVSRRVVSMFHFTLAESTRGLRVTRGLTNLTSQSVPVDRVQGVKLTQSLLWRRRGWWRVEADVVGYHGSNDTGSDATSVLVPVADAAQVQLALSRVLPGVALADIVLQPADRRARWVRWFDFWTLHAGWDDRALVTEHGWLVRERHIVPHAKTQSVRIEQGPLQRRLGLADVHVDTAKGPVRAVAQELEVDRARELALGQLDRARVARLAEHERRPIETVSAEVEADEDATADVLAAFGTSRDRLLGSGGETEVFAIDDERVLRLYRPGHEGPQQVVGQLRQLYAYWRDAPVDLALPQILQAGESYGRFVSVDRRFRGGPLSAWLKTAEPEVRRRALLSLLDATEQVARLPLAVPGFARLVGIDAPRSYVSLVELLNAMLAGPATRSRAQLERDVPDVGRVWQRLQAELAEREVTPTVVHGDLAASNVYVGEPDAEGRVRVVGVGDFSPHTLQADPLLDVTGAVAFLELEDYPDAVEDSRWLLAEAVERHGPEVAHWVGVYRRYFGFYFSDTAAFDPQTYAWCLRQLDSAGTDA